MSKTLIVTSESISDGGTVESLFDNEIVRSLSISDGLDITVQSLSISDGLDITALLHIPSQLVCITQHSQIHASVQLTCSPSNSSKIWELGKIITKLLDMYLGRIAYFALEEMIILYFFC